MAISEVTAVTTTDLTRSVGLVCWGAATHIAGAPTHCHAQIATSEKPFRSDKYRRAKKLAYRGTAGSSTGTGVSAGAKMAVFSSSVVKGGCHTRPVCHVC